MATNFPTSVDVLTNPVSNDSLNSPSHSAQHANANDAIEAVEDYLLNGAGKSGLVLVKSQAVGTGVASVTVTDAFNANYLNYKIIYAGGVKSVADAIKLNFVGSTTGYNFALLYSTFTTATPLAAVGSNQAAFDFVGGGDGNGAYLSCELMRPFDTSYTSFSATTYGLVTTSGYVSGIHKVGSSFSSFTLTPVSGTLTSGTIWVYGYKVA
jgi:hypothetical protein